MSLQILQTDSDIRKARSEMRARGLDFTNCWLTGILRKYGIMQGINIGDFKKSWDVLKSVDFIRDQLVLTDPVLDIGAYRSEMLPILNRLGFSSLTGIDLNDDIGSMPYNRTINYLAADCYRTPFGNESFAAVTAISVIEHGFNSKQLLAELGRIIRNGGYFIASLDYWPEKIDTAGISAYGMDWKIFSKDDVVEFIDDAEKVGLQPVGDLSFDAEKPLVSWMGKNFTFAWLVLRKCS
jgi:SAM-dependent methyltransferase